MPVVILDTNACLLPFVDRTDVKGELLRLAGAYALVMPQSVYDELTTLANHGGVKGRAANGALRMFAEARRVPTDLPGDDGVLSVVSALGGILVSNDRKLVKEAKQRGAKCISSRGDRQLDWA